MFVMDLMEVELVMEAYKLSMKVIIYVINRWKIINQVK